MLNESRDVASRFASSGLIARSLVHFSRGMASTSLPGFAELGNMVKELVEDWKKADYNDDELVWLAARLEDLCGLVSEFDVTEHPDVFNALRKFRELKISLGEGFKRRPCLGMHGAEQKQRLLDNLNHEIDRIVEVTLLRLVLVQAQSNKHDPIDNFRVIPAHGITDQIPIYNTIYPNPLNALASDTISWPLAPNRSVVTSSARRALLGRAPVMYKTFSSRSDNGVAAKVAEGGLKYLSRCLHPNIASIIGVTKGYDGLNGYVVAAEGMPLDQFLFRVNSGAALVKLVRGIDDILANMMTDTGHDIAYGIDVKHVTVKSDGHLTVFPQLAKDHGHLYIFSYLGLTENDRALLNPAVRKFLTIYESYRHTMREHYNPLYTGFFASVMSLGWKMLTELETVRLAAKHMVLPDKCNHYWRGPDTPPYTIGLGDIGYILYQNQQDTWSPIQLKPAPEIEWSYRYKCGTVEGRGTYREGGWTSASLHACENSWFQWEQEKSIEISYEWAKRIRKSLRSDGIQVKGARYCTSVSCFVAINRIGSIELPFERLYLHCNPSMRSNPQAFWGFLSTSDDPRSPPIVPGEVGLEFAYRVRYETYCLSDFWDYKYEEMLQSGLASIPGSYRGSHVEEVSEDEAAEDKSDVPPP